VAKGPNNTAEEDAAEPKYADDKVTDRKGQVLKKNYSGWHHNSLNIFLSCRSESSKY